jgi:uncharacterized membrane protein required for colicin V production
MSIIIDVIVVAIIWSVATVGYKKGLVKTVYGLLAFVIAAVITALYHEAVAEYLMKFDFIQKMIEDINQSIALNMTADSGAMPLWMKDAISVASMGVAEKIIQMIITVITVIVTFVGVKIILGFAVGIVDAIMKLPLLKTINSTGGMLFGVIQGVLIVLVICAVLTMFVPLESYENIHNAIGGTYIAKYFYNNNILMTLIMK